MDQMEEAIRNMAGHELLGVWTTEQIRNSLLAIAGEKNGYLKSDEADVCELCFRDLENVFHKPYKD